MELWIILVIIYGVLKGLRAPIKKKALEKTNLLGTLFMYTFIGFLISIPTANNPFSVDLSMLLLIICKSFVLFIAWIAAFYALKKLPVGLYGVMDMSRVVFSTLLAVLFLKESLTIKGVISLLIVITGLYLVNRKGKKGDEKASFKIILIMLLSCLLNGVSGVFDKYIMSTHKITSGDLQFWFMLILSLMYLIYILVKRERTNILKCIKNPYIYIISLLLVLGDRILFIANSFENSSVTVMTLVKQSSVIVTILCGKFIYKEKIAAKLLCGAIIILGIALSVI